MSKCLFVAPVAKKSPQKISSQNLSRSQRTRPHPFLACFTGEIPKNGLFSTILPFYVFGTMFLQYKW